MEEQEPQGLEIAEAHSAQIVMRHRYGKAGALEISSQMVKISLLFVMNRDDSYEPNLLSFEAEHFSMQISELAQCMRTLKAAHFL